MNLLPENSTIYKTYVAKIDTWDDYVNHVGYLVEDDIIVGVVGWGNVGQKAFDVSLSLARDDHSKNLLIYFPLRQGLKKFNLKQKDIPDFNGIHFNLPESGLTPKTPAYDFIGSNVKSLEAWWQMFYGDKQTKK